MLQVTWIFKSIFHEIADISCKFDVDFEMFSKVKFM